MQKLYIFALTLLAAGSTAYADSFFQVTVNTSSISGTHGSLDFQFNPGTGETQAATVQILNFAGGTYGGTNSTLGVESGGPLPTAVTLGNGLQKSPTATLNDYFETFTFGNTISFLLDLGGPAVTSPNGQSTGNSKFYFAMFSDANGSNPVLTSDPNGIAATVTVNPNGPVVAQAISPNLQFVPEPSSLWLVAVALGLAGSATLARRRLAQ